MNTELTSSLLYIAFWLENGEASLGEISRQKPSSDSYEEGASSSSSSKELPFTGYVFTTNLQKDDEWVNFVVNQTA